MVFLEKLPALTARSILQYIQSDAAKSYTGWFINKCRENVLWDHNFPKQVETMRGMNKELEQITLDTSNKVKVMADWEHLHTRVHQGELGINHTFQLMQTILTIENSIERSNEAKLLSNDILDTNRGIPNYLSVIHQVLVGQTATHTAEKGLLERWSNELFNNMSRNRMSSKMYLDYVDKYLSQAAIMQFKGILLLNGATTNTRLCSDQFDLFENNLKSQIETMQNTVPTYMTYLTDPNEKKVFVLRPVFDGKDIPFVKRLGPNRRLANDYLCGISEAGKWSFKKTPDFDENGSLYISGSSKEKYGQYYYMSESTKHKAVCVAGKHRATPFYVIPLDYKDKKIRLIICKSNSKPAEQLYLGNNLKFIDEHDNIEFILAFDSV